MAAGHPEQVIDLGLADEDLKIIAEGAGPLQRDALGKQTFLQLRSEGVAPCPGLIDGSHCHGALPRSALSMGEQHDGRDVEA